jgi:CRISPR-associated endonuclease/helicase Cas3
MSEVRFDQFFSAATGHAQPFHYQCRLACRPDATLDRPETLQRGSPCESKLIHIPTGLGKTAAVVLSWLWNRLLNQRDLSNPAQPPTGPAWPRRLVYCLPMRTLVEQTAGNVRQWLANLWQHRAELELSQAAREELLWLAGNGTAEHPAHSPVILMGGEELDAAQGDWDLYPEKPAILIGTQDMLLSRALNRGYAMSRYRWPMHFGLLNNDCLWVMDETQLMGVGLETSAQLDGFRHDNRLPTVGACPTWWMSATLDQSRLGTVDHPAPKGGWPAIRLEAADLQLPAVRDRVSAHKPVNRAPVSLSPATKKAYAAALADFVLKQHQPGSLTLVVLNRVDRAQALYQALQKLKPTEPLALVHSRFRPNDRRAHEAVLHQDGGRIVVATQAVEAGVDVSARTLVTELALWASLVQRFGRCNRRGEFKAGAAQIFWVDIETRSGSEELAWPYTPDELARARAALGKLSDAGPQTLATVGLSEPPAVRPVIRRKDLLELFDTTPDLAGHDLDVSRYIRDGQDTDVQVFWRDLGGAPPKPEEPQPAPAELCRVSLPRFRDFLAKLQKATDKLGHAAQPWTWNPLAEEWQPARAARAGATYLLDVRAGGYSAELGWTGEVASGPVVPLPPTVAAQDRSYGSDAASLLGVWVTLADHTAHVVAETTRLAQSLAAELAAVFPNANAVQFLSTAARWHDLGKAHAAFQQMLCGEDAARRADLWAKAANRNGRCPRPFFRHELASALAWLQTAPPNASERDLVAWLIAAHHGKVRLSIRSLPGEEPPADQPEARIARGVLEGDTLPPEAFVAIGASAPARPLSLSLELMEMGTGSSGEPSWLARMLALRDRFGPFRLAWLETLLRAADARASQKEAVP